MQICKTLDKSLWLFANLHDFMQFCASLASAAWVYAILYELMQSARVYANPHNFFKSVSVYVNLCKLAPICVSWHKSVQVYANVWVCENLPEFVQICTILSWAFKQDVSHTWYKV